MVEEKSPNDGRWVAGSIGNPSVFNGDADGSDALTNRHMKGGNIAFFDSHVQGLSNADYQDLYKNTHKWDPFNPQN